MYFIYIYINKYDIYIIYMCVYNGTVSTRGREWKKESTVNRQWMIVSIRFDTA